MWNKNKYRVQSVNANIYVNLITGISVKNNNKKKKPNNIYLNRITLYYLTNKFFSRIMFLDCFRFKVIVVGHTNHLR